MCRPGHPYPRHCHPRPQAADQATWVLYQQQQQLSAAAATTQAPALTTRGQAGLQGWALSRVGYG